MRYRVVGMDIRSKKPVELMLDAADEGAARADAAGRGVVAERVEMAAARVADSHQPVLVRMEHRLAFRRATAGSGLEWGNT